MSRTMGRKRVVAAASRVAGRSLIVATLDHNQMAELYVVRRELEGLAARLAARVEVGRAEGVDLPDFSPDGLAA